MPDFDLEVIQKITELTERCNRAEAERDALADKLAESDHALMQLGRLKAEWQAEALEEAAGRAPPHVAPWLKALARDYRRQAAPVSAGIDTTHDIEAGMAGRKG